VGAGVYSRAPIQGRTHLFELFHVNIELAPQFGFCLGEGGHLGGQVLRFLGLIIGFFPLLFVSRQVVLDFAFFCSHQGLEMQLAKLILLAEGSELLAEPRTCQVPLHSAVPYSRHIQLVQLHVELVAFWVLFLLYDKLDVV